MILACDDDDATNQNPAVMRSDLGDLQPNNKQMQQPQHDQSFGHIELNLRLIFIKLDNCDRFGLNQFHNKPFELNLTMNTLSIVRWNAILWKMACGTRHEHQNVESLY